MLRRKDVNMLEGSIVKGLLAMALPLMLANVIQSMYSIIDMRVLKQFDPGDGLAVGAVGACSTPLFPRWCGCARSGSSGYMRFTPSCPRAI